MGSEEFKSKLLSLAIEADFENPVPVITKKPLSHLGNRTEETQAHRAMAFKSCTGKDLTQYSISEKCIGMGNEELQLVIVYYDGSINAPINANVFKMVKTLLSLGYDLEP